MNLNDLVSPNILDLVPYKPGKPVEELQRAYNLKRVAKLASNENPASIPQNVVDAVVAELANVHTYPENSCYYLTERIAQYNGVDASNVIVGAGSVQIVAMIVKTFLAPGQKVLTSEKTFLMYRISAIETNGKDAIVEAPMGSDYTYDLDALRRLMDDQTKIIFIANPNNPTGTMLEKDALLDFIRSVPEDKIVVLDNAYQEYVANAADYVDGMREAVERKNVILLRTFSKIYSLAGFRVGYAVSSPEIIAYLNRVRPPFSVTRPAQVAAMASLENDDFKLESARRNIKNRAKLYQQLKDMGLQVFPSETNFLFFLPGTDPLKLNDLLLKEGVIIRPLQAFGAPEGMRVTVGFEEDNDFFVEKLKKVLHQ